MIHTVPLGKFKLFKKCESIAEKIANSVTYNGRRKYILNTRLEKLCFDHFHSNSIVRLKEIS